MLPAPPSPEIYKPFHSTEPEPIVRIAKPSDIYARMLGPTASQTHWADAERRAVTFTKAFTMSEDLLGSEFGLDGHRRPRSAPVRKKSAAASKPQPKAGGATGAGVRAEDADINAGGSERADILINGTHADEEEEASRPTRRGTTYHLPPELKKKAPRPAAEDAAALPASRLVPARFEPVRESHSTFGPKMPHAAKVPAVRAPGQRRAATPTLRGGGEQRPGDGGEATTAASSTSSKGKESERSGTATVSRALQARREDMRCAKALKESDAAAKRASAEAAAAAEAKREERREARRQTCGERRLVLAPADRQALVAWSMGQAKARMQAARAAAASRVAREQTRQAKLQQLAHEREAEVRVSVAAWQAEVAAAREERTERFRAARGERRMAGAVLYLHKTQKRVEAAMQDGTWQEALQEANR